MTLSFVAEATSGRLVPEFQSRQILNVCTDTRSLTSGSLYVPIRGERFDGHDFIEDAWESGAVAALWAGERLPDGAQSRPLIAVDDTREALGALAKAYRRGYPIPVCAIGGSNGKTTTKEMVAAVLEARYRVVKSPASFNNDIGAPLSLFQIDKTTDVGVFEIGSNHPGEVRPLRDIVDPSIGIVTNIGREHLENFVDVQGVFDEESVLLDALPKEAGLALIDGDSEWSAPLAEVAPCRVIRVGLEGPKLDWRGVDWSMSATGVQFYAEKADGLRCGPFRIQPLGRHQVTNALFAIALGFEFGIEESCIQSALAECEPAPMRMRPREYNGAVIIEDCYNANPDSALAALDTLRHLETPSRRIVVFGGMAEMGASLEEGSQEVGRRAAELKVDHLMAVGEEAREIVEGARTFGGIDATWVASAEEAGAWLGETVRPGDTVLIKGSRTARLERVLTLLNDRKAN